MSNYGKEKATMNHIHWKSEHYFAAANTHKGFESMFSTIFTRNSFNRLYILKGGPGVGKSTFMKKAAAVLEKSGNAVTYYHCSSDPDSLDGITVEKKKIAIVDGTSPHAVEAKLAGAYEEIVDLGRAWDTEALSLLADELYDLSSQKAECYKNAYKNLEASQKICTILQGYYDRCILSDKLTKSADRLAKSIISEDNKFCRRDVLLNAISCKGKVRFCTFDDMAEYCIFVKQPYYQSRLSEMFFDRLLYQAQKKKAEVIVSLSPFDTSVIDGLYFPKSGVSVTVHSDELVSLCDRLGKKCKIVNTARFADTAFISPSAKERKYYEKTAKALEEKALKCLEKAGLLHALLEEKYASCTDYSVVESITAESLQKLAVN